MKRITQFTIYTQFLLIVAIMPKYDDLLSILKGSFENAASIDHAIRVLKQSKSKQQQNNFHQNFH